ncbi:MAG: hypothetical protein QXK74_07450 [Candidatus Nitrosocaldaceae archaeon]
MFIPIIFTDAGSISAVNIEHHLVGEKAPDSLRFQTPYPPALHSNVQLIYLPVYVKSKIPILYNMFVPHNEGQVLIKPFSNFQMPIASNSTDITISRNIQNVNLLTNYTYPKQFTIAVMAELSSSGSTTYLYSDSANNVQIYRNTTNKLVVKVGSGTLTSSLDLNNGTQLVIVTFSSTQTQTSVTAYATPVYSSSQEQSMNLQTYINSTLNYIPTTSNINVNVSQNALICHHIALFEETFTSDQVERYARIYADMSRRPILTSFKFRVVEIVRQENEGMYEVKCISLLGTASAREVIRFYENTSTQNILSNIFSTYAPDLYPVFFWSQNKTYESLNISTKFIDIVFLLTKANSASDIFSTNEYVYFIDPFPAINNLIYTNKQMTLKNVQNTYGQTNKVIVYNTTPAERLTESFTGNGTQTSFTLKYIPNEIEVYVNSIKQVLGVDYNVNNKVITFKTAPANNASIQVNYSALYSIIATAKSITGFDEKKVYISGTMNFNDMKTYATSLLEAENRSSHEITGYNDCRVFPALILTYKNQIAQLARYYYYMVYNQKVYDEVSQTQVYPSQFTVFQGHQLRSYDFIKTAFALTSASEQLDHTLAQSVNDSYIFFVKLVKGTSTVQAGRIVTFGADFDIDTTSSTDIVIKLKDSAGNVADTTNINISSMNVISILIQRNAGDYNIYSGDKLIKRVSLASPPTTDKINVQYGASGSSLTNLYYDTLIIAQNDQNILNTLAGDAYYHVLTHNTTYRITEMKINGARMQGTVFQYQYDTLQIEKEYYEKIHSLEELTLSKSNTQQVLSQDEILLIADVVSTTFLPALAGWDITNWEAGVYS